MVSVQGGKARPRLLLVDDEADILETMSALLEAAMPELHLTTAASGTQALQALKQEPADVLLTDYRMPGMDGAQLVSEVRKRWPKVQVLMFTAYMDANMLSEIHARVPDLKIIPKPLDVEFVLQQLREAFAAARAGA